MCCQITAVSDPITEIYIAQHFFLFTSKKLCNFHHFVMTNLKWTDITKLSGINFCGATDYYLCVPDDKN